MPNIIYELINLLASVLRLLGMGVVGVVFGWLSLDLLGKSPVWQMLIALFLGLVGLAIALAIFLPAGALGGFGIGLGVAVFIWGLPKKKKEED
jgi:hypothetical protein